MKDSSQAEAKDIDQNVALVRHYWDAIEARNWKTAWAVLHPEFTAAWPTTNETFDRASFEGRSVLLCSRAAPLRSFFLDTIETVLRDRSNDLSVVGISIVAERLQ